MGPDQIILHEIAVVIVGENHNPSILNPDFLWHNDIVPEGLEVSGPVIGTPAFSRVVYASGLRIDSEPGRISFAESIRGGQPPVCPGVARRYLRAVPHVRYTAVGVNPGTILDATGQFAPAGLLKAGSRMQFDGVSPSAEIMLIYRLDGQTVNLTVKTGRDPNGVKKVVAFHGNFHRNIEGEKSESHMVAHAIVGEWEKYAADFIRLVENIAKEMKE